MVTDETRKTIAKEVFGDEYSETDYFFNTCYESNDKTFENSQLFQVKNSSIAFVGDKWFIAGNGEVMQYKLTTDTEGITEEVKVIYKEKYKNLDVEAYNGKVYFNTLDKVYVFDPEQDLSKSNPSICKSFKDKTLVGMCTKNNKLYVEYLDSNNNRQSEVCSDVQQSAVQSVSIAGNGDGNWLNNAMWKSNAVDNVMQYNSKKNCYTITYHGLESGKKYSFLFAPNGALNNAVGFGTMNPDGTTLTGKGKLDGKPICFELPEDYTRADVTITYYADTKKYIIHFD